MAKKIKIAGMEFVEYDSWEESARAIGLSNEDIFLIKFKNTMLSKIKKTMEKNNITQKSLADKLETKQPQIAQVLNGEKAVTVDYLIKILLNLGIEPDCGKFKKAA